MTHPGMVGRCSNCGGDLPHAKCPKCFPSPSEAEGEGWKLVPTEPTEKMLGAAIHCLDGVNLMKQAPTRAGRATYKARARYCAMLASAPSRSEEK